MKLGRLTGQIQPKPRWVMALGYGLIGLGFAANHFAHSVPALVACMVVFTLGEMFARYVESGTTLIAGAELGGIALAAAASLAANKPFVIIRNAKKDYGTGKPYEGKISDSDSVLLVEDIATTGGQVLEAAKFIKSVGARVERIVAVIDRQEGARENIEGAGFKFESLFTKADLGIAN